MQEIELPPKRTIDRGRADFSCSGLDRIHPRNKVELRDCRQRQHQDNHDMHGSKQRNPPLPDLELNKRGNQINRAAGESYQCSAINEPRTTIPAMWGEGSAENETCATITRKTTPPTQSAIDSTIRNRTKFIPAV